MVVENLQKYSKTFWRDQKVCFIIQSAKLNPEKILENKICRNFKM